MQKTAPVLMHLAGWLLFLALIFSFLSISPASESFVNTLISFPFFVFLLTFLLVFYGNAFLLRKLYEQKNNYLLYTVIVLAAISLVYYMEPFDQLLSVTRSGGVNGPDQHLKPPPQRPVFDIISMILFLMAWSLSTASAVIRHYRDRREKSAYAIADKTKAELSVLKAQIQPHFLFNTLNNIYSLTLVNDERAPDAVMKLSGIMRYVTEEASNDFVPLEKEICCASDYIDLQRLRLNGKTKIDFKVSGNPVGKQIVPLVFLSFIETTFKYGISSHEEAPITIHIHANDQVINFVCSNRLFSKMLNCEEEEAANLVRNRLRHAYPGSHSLEIKTEDDIYSISLNIFY